MNLIIEQGNTSTKVAVFHNMQLIKSYVFELFNVSVLSDIFDNYTLKYGMMSTVALPDEKIYDYLAEHLVGFFVLTHDTPVPITIGYETPETLGLDRLAAVVGANYLQPDRDVLVIDAGTAITYELIDSKGVYLGGNISPGMTTRFKALNHFTKRLPLVNEEEKVPLLGTSTKTAIQAGVVQGIIYEMEGYISELQGKYPDLLVFLTGGHSFYFERRLKKRIFADVNLVLIGINRILEYNVEN